MATHRICDILIKSFTQSCSDRLHPARWRTRLATVLWSREFHGDAIQEFVRVAAAYLKLHNRQGDVLKNLRLASRRSPFRKELSRVASEAFEEARSSEERA